MRLVLMIALALFISYVDRGNLATAAPLIEAELRLSPEQLGLLLSAFFVTYVLAMVPAGWLAERYGAYRVLAAGIFIWSVATLCVGFVGSFIALLLLRLLLGLGESTTFPCLSKLIANGVPAAHIGRANGIVAFGYLIGPAIGTFVGGLLIARFGWRPVFVLFGVASMLWLLPWSRVVVPEARLKDQADAGPSFAQILRERGLWGASLGHFSENYAFYLILTWLPEYLVRVRGFSLETMAAVASGAYLVNAVAAYVAGWATDRWIRSGRSPDVAYKGIMALNHLAAIGCMAGIVVLPSNQSIACLYIYELFMGFAAPGTFAIAQILAGPGASARWVGVQNMCGNIAGIAAPAITGFIVGATGRYDRAFTLAAAVNVLGLVGWVLILPKIAPIQWNRNKRAALASPAIGS
jgi:MFS family permease